MGDGENTHLNLNFDPKVRLAVAHKVKRPPLPIERQITTPKDGIVSLIGWLTASGSDTTMALVEDGA